MRYFFGDESGTLGQRNEWFVMGGYHINEDDQRDLDRRWRQIYREYSISIKEEVKHSALSSLCRGLPVRDPTEPQYKCLAHLDTNALRKLATSILNLINSLESLKIIMAVGRPEEVMKMPFVVNADTKLWTRHEAVEVRCIGMFIQNLMQRFEMDLRESHEEGQMHFDNISKQGAHKALQNFHSMLIRGKADHYVKYRYLQPLLGFHEHHNQWGLQLADHICGICAGFLRGDESSVQEINAIWSKIRTAKNNTVAGKGIIGVPPGTVNENMLKQLRVNK